MAFVKYGVKNTFDKPYTGYSYELYGAEGTYLPSDARTVEAVLTDQSIKALTSFKSLFSSLISV